MTIEKLDLITDAPSRERILTLHPVVRQSAVDAYLDAMAHLSGKNTLRVTHALRTFKQQNDLFAKGRDANGNKVGATVTNARGGQSYHNYGLALDFVLRHVDGKVSYSLKEDLDADGVADWREVAEAFKRAGWSWGGEWNTFKDNPHVQKTLGYTWKRLLARYNAGDRDDDGYVRL